MEAGDSTRRGAFILASAGGSDCVASAPCANVGPVGAIGHPVVPAEGQPPCGSDGLASDMPPSGSPCQHETAIESAEGAEIRGTLPFQQMVAMNSAQILELLQACAESAQATTIVNVANTEFFQSEAPPETHLVTLVFRRDRQCTLQFAVGDAVVTASASDAEEWAPLS